MDIPSTPAPTDRSWWVTPSLLGGAYPGAFDPHEAQQKIQALLDAGVTLFLDLTTEHDSLEPYEALLAASGSEAAGDRREIRRVNLPVPDVSVPTDDVVHEACRILDEEIADGGIAYVHCWGGRGRTGAIIGCWLARDIGGPAALEVLDRIRAGSADAASPAPETRGQRELVASWPRRDAAAR